ncbi:DUF2848 domain-containing protein [Thalassospira alkalitolerans]|uniref:DUF2848 domain-containing protein n=1 Tax=Thalassospira alkalitolerans TaxID=1293890 RepID=A0A1Y2L9B2_9PROT|nr:DUF2848 domain-containing protein [Thalassospira alkalitolerans]OSQ46630.1 hypothetical protein TALK_15545 [Thalassospira alkalitolerans]
MQMNFTLDGSAVTFDFGHCTVAGWTGRDAKAIQHHIDELAAIGVKPPSTVPLYYRTSFGMLTQAPVIEVVGSGTSGEVEPLLVAKDGVLYLGLASDHTDRELEAHSVALSKQICAKPVANTLWQYDDVADHIEQIELKSWIREGDRDDWVPYQEGTIASIRPLGDLIDGSGLVAAGNHGVASAMLCGTFGAKGGVRPARSFKMAMHDSVRDRTITHSYDVVELPEIA